MTEVVMVKITVSVAFKRHKDQWSAVAKTLVEGEPVYEDVFCLVEGPYTDDNGESAWVHARGNSHTPRAIRDLKAIVNERWNAEVARWVLE